MTATTPDVERLAGLPKVELHLHLEGCVTAETLLKLSAEHGLKLPPHILETQALLFRTFDEFVHTTTRYATHYGGPRTFAVP